ncbi:FusB/FusC family EF-G-binding protein [Ureibacillus thermophilus]|uniref:Elongation factor G-binding protein n=2 Tax=Ureibacillus TaxID=160795 RepID=A0A4P6UXA1_9BACL|nr:FusB/FusC family EF-G-binding protein [Ureibacillus thermophilus]MBO2506794.1 elongation factor G-binding protein [Bacilli bacterium]QBK26946.1 elongation factor G-binding protein [Ureibacillus thermophilus]
MENKNTEMNLKPFIRNDQFNFIKFELKNIISAHLSVKDKETLDALKLYAFDKIQNLFPDLNEEQSERLYKIIDIEEETQAKHFLHELKQYVIPFANLTENAIRKLFPKIGKLKVPPLVEMDCREISYLGWNDVGLGRKFLVVEYDGKLMGIEGTFKESHKGICSICNRLEEIGLFVANVKSGKESYVNRGNYICKNSVKCNQNITSLDKLNSFIEVLKK